MYPKKNPKADLSKSSGLFFAIGFAVISGFTLWGFESKMYDKSNLDNRKSDYDKVLDEDPVAVTIEQPTIPVTPPPPPPQVVPAVNVVDNDAHIIETTIASTEDDKKSPIIDPGVIHTPEPVVVEEPEVSFYVIEEKPMFKECENVPKAQQAKCFQEALNRHVSKNFVYPQAALDMGVQGKVFVSFRINTDGSITVLGTRGPDKLLEAEAERIIKKLPKLIPGKQRNKATAVTFAYPINFVLQQ